MRAAVATAAASPAARPITVPQTVVLMALDQGIQPWMPPCIRERALKAGWIARAGIRKTMKGFRLPNWSITDAGRAALAASPHTEVAAARLRAGLQKGPWL